jgi:hypothetical protein
MIWLMSNPVSPDILRVHERLNNDLEFFCRKALRIKAKSGGIIPFNWNKAQHYLDQRIEDHLRRTGMVRLLILKGRQQGISTYIEGRLYRNTTRRWAKRAFILTHHSTATENLFQMVEKYHESCPDEIKPVLLAANNRRMQFDNESQYTVGTAGTGAIGRSDTNQYLHWSEVAFSENVDGIVTGLLQTVPDAPGTEIFLESTANGEGNFFHTACMQALRGESQYELVFIPWHWQPEYRAATTPEFDLTDEEVELQEMYELDDEQIQWRRNKIASFKAAGYGPQKFKQEYPFTIEEAFQSSGSRLIDGDAVARARKAQITDNNAPLIFGIDPAPLHDRSVICWRQGRQIIKNEVFTGVDSMAMVGKIAKRIDKFEPAKVFIDVGGGGREIASRLCELGYGRVVTAIPFSMKPTDDELYINKRAEMAGEFKQWLEDQVGVRIPDDDVFATEIGAIPEFKTTSTGKSQLVSKEDIIKKFGRSTDLFDAAMLTFAMPVQKDFQNSKITKSSVRRTQSELTTLMARRRNNQSTNSRLTEYDDDERKPGYHRNGPVFKGRR